MYLVENCATLRGGLVSP